MSADRGTKRKYRVTAVSAERQLDFAPVEGPSFKVTLRLGVSRRDQKHTYGDWVCPYEILGFKKARRRWAFGVDGIQALTLAYHLLPAELARLAREAGGGSFSFLGDSGIWLTDGCNLLLNDLVNTSVATRASGRTPKE